MSVRSTVAGVLASGSVLLIGWMVGSAGTDLPGGGTTAVAAPSGSGAGAAASTTAPSGGPASTAAGTFTGQSVATRFGDVQVAVQVSGGRITDVTALALTDHDGRSVSISNHAAPILRSEVLTSQSASVSMVSGATYTSQAYLTSVQSALDQAGL